MILTSCVSQTNICAELVQMRDQHWCITAHTFVVELSARAIPEQSPLASEAVEPASRNSRRRKPQRSDIGTECGSD
jgi:hypothetical protein